MTVHELKTWPDPFNALLDGVKTYEVRRSDREYAVGDELQLREWSPAPFVNRYGSSCEPGYTGRLARFAVTFLTPGGEWGLPPDLCVMAVRPLFVCEQCGGVSISYTLDGADSKFVCERYPQCGRGDRDSDPKPLRPRSFAHDCALVLRVEPNDDELLTCWLCHGLTHIPCELSSTFYTRDGRATVGLHRGCYDRARVKTREPLRPRS